MRITNKKSQPKRTKVLLAIAVAALLVAGLGYYIYAQQKTGIESQETSSGVNQSKDGASTKTSEDKAREEKQNAEEKQKYIDKQTSTNDSEGSTATKPTSDYITLSAQTGKDAVTVITKLSSVSSGTCTLTVTNGDKTDSQTASVIYQPEYSSCAGFEIQRSKLGSGTWTIRLSVQTADGTLEKSINYKV